MASYKTPIYTLNWRLRAFKQLIHNVTMKAFHLLLRLWLGVDVHMTQMANVESKLFPNLQEIILKYKVQFDGNQFLDTPNKGERTFNNF